MLKSIVKYFSLNLVVNIIDIPISFLISIIYLSKNPPTTSLFIEPLFIGFIFIPVVSLFVSLFSTIFMVVKNTNLSVAKRIILTFINIIIPLFIVIQLFIVPAIKSKQKEVEHIKRERIIIEDFRKDGLRIYDCQDYLQFTVNSSVEISNYLKDPGLYIKCNIESKLSLDLHIQSSVKPYDKNGNLINYPLQTELYIGQVLGQTGIGQPNSLKGGSFFIHSGVKWNDLVVKIQLPPNKVSYFVLNLSFNDINLRLDYPNEVSVKGHWMDFEYKTKTYNFP